jgi:hypothetical protein
MNFKEFIDKGVPKINYVSILEVNPNLQDDIRFFLDHYRQNKSENNIRLKERIFRTVKGKRVIINGKTFLVRDCVSGFPTITLRGIIIGVNSDRVAWYVEEVFNSFEFCENPDMIQVYANPRRHDEVDPYGEEDDWDIENEEYEWDEDDFQKYRKMIENERKKEFKIGDRVISKENSFIGDNNRREKLLGKVIYIFPGETYVGVEFDEFISGHTCDGFGGKGKPGKHGHCWNVVKSRLEIIDPVEKINDEDIEWF